MDEQPQLRLRSLLSGDTDAVCRLYREVSAHVAYGHLANRTLADFAAILSPAETSASIGAWVGERLVAYSLCCRQQEDVHAHIPLFRHLPEGEPLWTGKGTVVDPRFEGRLLQSRLLKMRGEQIAAKGALHTSGMIATTNYPSLASTLRPGAWIVGLERDEYCENFVCYAGRLQERYELVTPTDVAADDLGTLAEMLLGGWVGTAMRKAAACDGRNLVLAKLSRLP
jgi:hypothetical protein